MAYILPAPSLPPRVRWFAACAALALLYFAAARLGLHLAYEDTNASPVWPPSGIACAVLLLGGLRLWPGIALGALIANFTSFWDNQVASVPVMLITSAGIAVGNTLEGVVAAWLSARMVRNRGSLIHSQVIYPFAGIAIASCLLGALIGTGCLLVSGIAPDSLGPTILLTWWVGDLASILVICPVLLACAAAWRSQKTSRAWRRDAFHAISIIIVVLTLGYCIFLSTVPTQETQRIAAFLFFPLLAWSAYRFAAPGATLCVLLSCALAVLGTQAGHGPFASSDLNDSLIMLESFIVLCALAGLMLAADRMESAGNGPAPDIWRSVGAHWLITLAAIGLTFLGWALVSAATQREAQERFDQIAHQIDEAIIHRIDHHIQLLRSGRALFAAAAQVSREDWRVFVDSLSITRNYPGLQGIGYVEMIPASRLSAHIQRVRNEGFPDYTVRPPGPRDQYSAILYLEPFDWRNQRAFGYDMLSEPIRHAALSAARDSGEPTVSERVTLMQETEEDRQAGFLMYLPVYVKGLPTRTPAERTSALRGFVYSPFRARDLLQAVLGSHGLLNQAALELYDGTQASEATLMFRSEAQPAGFSPHFQREHRLMIASHTWTAHIRSLPSFERSIDHQKGQIVLISGVVISLLLFSALRSLAYTRTAALKLADEMTHALQVESRKLQEREALLRSAMHHAATGTAITDLRGRFLRTNPALHTMLGLGDENITGKLLQDFLADDAQRSVQSFLDSPTGENSDTHLQLECRLKRRYGDLRFVLLVTSRAVDAHGTPFCLAVQVLDIDREKRMQAERETFVRQLTRHAEDLARSNHELDNFAYVASHDLRAPLRGIHQLASWLQEDLQAHLDANSRNHLDLLKRRVERLDHLLRDLLVYSRVGRDKDAWQEVDLRAILNEAFTLASAPAGFQLMLPEALPTLNAPRVALEQVLRNLIGNSVKHHDRNSGTIRVDYAATDSQHVIRIIDDGPGIPPELHEKAFAMFQTLRPRDHAEGSGMGLALVRKIIENLGGHVHIESDGVRGTCIHLSWPIQRNDEKEAANIT